jgi:hypothetical protein
LRLALIPGRRQLGVNNANAIRNGGLAGNNKFFGSNTAEITSVAATNGSWNGDTNYSMRSALPWNVLGGYSYGGAGAGIFGPDDDSGGVGPTLGHRTTLSGY